MDLKETELTLGLPGKSSDRARRSMKRNLKTRNPKSEEEEEEEGGGGSSSSTNTNPPSSEVQLVVVGWPPVKASRAGMMNKNISCGCKYVKVAVDGAPYLRKVDLEMYDGYAQLFKALQDLFPPFTILRNYYFSDGCTLMDGLVPTFEDKDGDWMMVGDFPWKMFKESCKRIRLMKNSEAIGLD